MAKRSKWVAVGTHLSRYGRECKLPSGGRDILKWGRYKEALCPQCGGPLPKSNRIKVDLVLERKELKELLDTEEARINIRDSKKWPRCLHGSILGACHDC